MCPNGLHCMCIPKGACVYDGEWAKGRRWRLRGHYSDSQYVHAVAHIPHELARKCPHTPGYKAPLVSHLAGVVGMHAARSPTCKLQVQHIAPPLRRDPRMVDDEV